MGLAARKGKLAIAGDEFDVKELAWQRYEDVLTADIFGAYRYLPPALGIVSILNHAVDERGRTFSRFLEKFGIEPSDFDVARIRFWPTLDDGREPDLFVLLESTVTKQGLAILVEVKYHAQQHLIAVDGDTRSQLGHYLIKHRADAYSQGTIPWLLPDRDAPRPVLYITKHAEPPAAELEQAKQDALKSLSGEMSDELGVFWTNWSKIGAEAKRLWRLHRTRVAAEPWLRILLDIHEELNDRDLLSRPPFSGIKTPDFESSEFLYGRKYIVSASPPNDLARRFASRGFVVPFDRRESPQPIYRTRKVP